MNTIVNILVNLPFSLQREVLCCWLNYTDVAVLDSAVCCRVNRPIFLDLLSNKELMLDYHRFVGCDKLSSWMKWVYNRKVCFNTCIISSTISPEHYMQFFAAIGWNLHTLVVFTKDKLYRQSVYASLLATAACYCASLREVHITQCASICSLENILRSSQNTIKKLTLDECNLGELQVRSISLVSLQHLIIQNCTDASDTVMTALLQAAPSLEILVCRYVDAIPVQAVISQNVRIMQIAYCTVLTDTILSALIHKCSLLEQVQLWHCTNLTDTSVIELVQSAKHLHSLSLGRISNFTDAALEAVAKHCGERMRHLFLCHCSNITNVGLVHISRACTCMEGFALEEMQHISVNAVTAVLRVNPLLQEVALCTLREDEGDVLLTVLSTCCLHLQYLKMYTLKGYSEQGMFTLIRSCLQLRRVLVHRHCTVVSPLSRLLWKELRPSVEIEGTARRPPVWIDHTAVHVPGTTMEMEEGVEAELLEEEVEGVLEEGVEGVLE